MEIQREISREKNEKKIGTTLHVIIDRKEKNKWVGRTEADSPEVDQEVHILGAVGSLSPGTFVPVLIKEAEDYDLLGEIA